MVNFLNEANRNKIVNSYSLSNIRASNAVMFRMKQEEKEWETTISSKINSGGPLLFGRLGGIEAHCLGLHLDSLNGLGSPIRYLQSKMFLNHRLSQLQTNAGVYPINKETYEYFCEEYLDALLEMDIFSVWGKPFAWVESKVLSKKDTTFVSGHASYPWLEPRDGVSDVGWGAVLEGKKVLVVSPFIDSIAYQVPNLDRVFRSLVIPKVDFQYLRAPMTQGGLLDGSSFREHLQKLKNEISSFDFDIAMISAGAYSLPLANWAKGMGKIGIHAGGAMQLFFGITGQRYDGYPEVTRHFNEYWKRPFLHERPVNWQSIEGGCYW